MKEPSPTDGSGDAEVAALASAIEAFAAETYGMAFTAATNGDLGEIPPAVAEYATTAQAQHQVASEALAEAAGSKTAEVPESVRTAVMEGFGQVTDVATWNS